MQARSIIGALSPHAFPLSERPLLFARGSAGIQAENVILLTPCFITE
jgi:hypothetical protein